MLTKKIFVDKVFTIILQEVGLKKEYESDSSSRVHCPAVVRLWRWLLSLKIKFVNCSRSLLRPSLMTPGMMLSYIIFRNITFATVKTFQCFQSLPGTNMKLSTIKIPELRIVVKGTTTPSTRFSIRASRVSGKSWIVFVQIRFVAKRFRRTPRIDVKRSTVELATSKLPSVFMWRDFHRWTLSMINFNITQEQRLCSRSQLKRFLMPGYLLNKLFSF